MVAKGNTASLGFVVVIVAFFLGDLFSADSVPLYGDLAFFVLPMKHFLAEQMHLGRIALWNPWIYLGTPFLAGLQTGVFYPPSVLFALPFPLGFNLFVLAHYFIALAGSWAFLRDRSLSHGASGVGSVAFTLGGYSLSMLPETNHLQAAVWAPWVLLFWSRYCRDRRWLDLAIFVATGTVELLAGAPETMLMTIAIAAGWTVWISWRKPISLFGLGAALSGGLLLVLLIGSFQILPTSEYVAESDRVEHLPLEEVSAWSLEPISLAELVLPRTAPATSDDHDGFPLGLESYAPWIQSLYLGIVPLCLVFAGLVGGRDRMFWALLLTTALLLALGSHTPLLTLLYRLAPSVVGRFRYPQKLYFLVHLSACVLAAEGFDAVARSRFRAFATACLAAAAIVASLAMVRSEASTNPQHVADIVGAIRGTNVPEVIARLTAQITYLSLRSASIAGVFLVIVILRRFELIRPAVVELLMILVVAGDLGTVHRGLHSTVSWSTLTSLPVVVDADQVKTDQQRIFHYQTMSAAFPGARPEPVTGLQELDRVTPADENATALWLDTWRILFADIGMVYRLGTVSGGDGIGRRSNALLLSTLSALPREQAIRLLGLYSAGWLVGTAPLDGTAVERVFPVPPSRYYVYRLRDPVPEARLVFALDAMPADDRALRHLVAPDFAVDRTAVVEALPPGWGNSPPDRRATGRVDIVSYEPSRVTLDVESEGRAFLVLNDSYFPGWEARVDGEPAEIFRTNVFVRGLPLMTGRHRVDFLYRPTSFIRGAMLSGLGLLTFAVLVAKGLRESR